MNFFFTLPRATLSKNTKPLHAVTRRQQRRCVRLSVPATSDGCTFSFFRPISLPPPLAAPASRLTHKKKKLRTATSQWPNQPVWTCGSRPPPPAEEACYRPVSPSAATSILRLAVPFFQLTTRRQSYPDQVNTDRHRASYGHIAVPSGRGFFLNVFPILSAFQDSRPS